jgi:ribosome modulation factor
MRPWWGPEAANMTAEERAKARLSGSWVRGFNAFHALYLLEDCPAGDAQLQEQWRAGWRAAQSDALKEAANGR